MSDSEREDQQENYSFLGFEDLFITLAQEHENNIIEAIRRYSTLQDRDESDQQANQRVVSSTPLATPTETPLGTPHVTPIHTPIGSPRSRLRTADFQSADWSRSSQPTLVSDISLTINSLPVKAASSLPNINLLSTRKKTTMSYQAFDRSLRCIPNLRKKYRRA